jgi:LPXTG-site transpeptidase (sortase) family protein
VRRRALGSALQAVGVVLLLLSVATVGYGQWSDWQHALNQPVGPQESLPERLDGYLPEASSASGEGGEAALPAPTSDLPEGADAPSGAIRTMPLEGVIPAPEAIGLGWTEPTATARPPAGETPVAPPSADSAWQATLGQLDGVWASDWPEAIALLEAFHEQFPEHEEGKNKLYAALVSYGRDLIDNDMATEGAALLERARELRPGPNEAGLALLALTPTAVPEASSPGPASGGSYGAPTWLSIPRIGVNSAVSPVWLSGGEYQVPSYNVGYHADSAEPGQAGNAVFDGHLTTINAGRVFGRLQELRPGDAVYVYTSTHRLDWVVKSAGLVPNADYSFILPTGDTRITLYTCGGRWVPLARDYSHRLVVVGGLVRVAPRS